MVGKIKEKYIGHVVEITKGKDFDPNLAPVQDIDYINLGGRRRMMAEIIAFEDEEENCYTAKLLDGQYDGTKILIYEDYIEKEGSALGRCFKLLSKLEYKVLEILGEI